MPKINFAENFKTIFQSPAFIVTLIAIIIVVVAIYKFRKVKLTTRMITHIGIALALSVVLSFIKFVHLPFGGSTTLGSMVPIILLALVYGPEVGFLSGFVYGLLNLIIDPYIVHPAQLLLDYPFAYMSLGLAGYFRNQKFIAPIAAISGRFIFHFLSGVIFFASDAGTQNVYLYSLTYNGSYLLPELIITLVVIAVLPIERLSKSLAAAH
ncbi:energy-coupled thiamine transporter ThiT [Clostridium sp. 19966]|uniref:energy-coupled thiamine transporter ThiT n=1 Tax=Clostridium sp. 19966 TaxID=2768166 RepID=UPI0028DDAEE8|nr:energy-coupled thiamine transporter ThiT [Clostridium sp. 19966]MDT8717283.1 energy-coupled thiamine transporter ThiT [Clostridium sp. 19966]